MDDLTWTPECDVLELLYRATYLALNSSRLSVVSSFIPIVITAMRSSLRLLAAPVTPAFRPGQRAPALALLPPIPLYRRLLRTHRKKLNPEERVFGDTYLKAEFRRHRDIENPLHIVGFLTEWQQYGQQLEGDDWKGQKLDVGLVDKMSDQQIGQMYELMQAIQKTGRDTVDEEEEGQVLRAIEEASSGNKKES